MFLRFWECLLVTWLKVKTKQKIVYKVFLTIDFLQITTRLAITCVIKLGAMRPRMLSQNKLVL